jgi:hypothetical protein
MIHHFHLIKEKKYKDEKIKSAEYGGLPIIVVINFG